MTNWEKIKEYYSNIDKEFAVQNYAVVKNVNDKYILIPCQYVSCRCCIFDWKKDCRADMRKFFEKEVNE